MTTILQSDALPSELSGDNLSRNCFFIIVLPTDTDVEVQGFFDDFQTKFCLPKRELS